MDWWLLTFFLGAILSLFLPEVPAIYQLFLLLCLAIGFYTKNKLRYSAGICFGALWILTQAYLYQHQLPIDFIDKMQRKQLLVVEGQVLTLQVMQVQPTTTLNKGEIGNVVAKEHQETKRFNFLVSKVNQQQLSKPFIIRLSWQKASLAVAQGQRLYLNVKLKPAHGLANIGTFNYLSWLKSHNIVATGYVINPRKKPKENLNSLAKGNSLAEVNSLKKVSTERKKNRLLIETSTIRQQLFAQYQKLAPKHTLSPILFALAFGERSLLDPAHWQVLQATGTSHLIAISGLHIGLLAGSAFFMAMLFLKNLPLTNPRWQGLNIRYFAIAISVLLATSYAYLAGFSLPTQRALVMLNLYWFSRLAGIKFSSKRLVLLTIFALLMFSPFSLLTASFWLSFYAVAIIFVTLWRFSSWLAMGSSVWRFFKGLFIIQVALTVMLMPISAFFFQQISLVSLLANIIAVPWMSAISIPSALLSVLLMPLNEQLAQWSMMISLQSLSWLWFYLVLLSKQNHAIISLSMVQQTLVLIIGVFIFVMFYLAPFYWSRRVKQGVFILLISMPMLGFLGLVLKEPHDQNSDIASKAEHNFTPWQVVFFDVGQGLSVLVKRNKHAILYDTGAAYPSGFTLSEAVILPYLQYSAIEQLDKVILSHSDNDHAGGIKSLLVNIIINEIISNDESIFKATDTTSIKPTLTKPPISILTNLPRSNPSLTACLPERSFTWQGLSFDILWPLAQKSAEDSVSQGKEKNIGKQKNDDSCVILISDSQGNKLLLTGDISSKVERQLLRLYPQLSVDILQVPHHGSKTSSSQAFLRQLSPEIALVSAGYLNRWYMPVAAVRRRYHDENIQLLNSAELGQVIITFDESGISRQTYVQDLRPFWFSH